MPPTLQTKKKLYSMQLYHSDTGVGHFRDMKWTFRDKSDEWNYNFPYNKDKKSNKGRVKQ